MSNTIPVYGLSGLNEGSVALHNLRLGSLAQVPGPGFGASFLHYASSVSPQRRAALMKRHAEELATLRGIYTEAKKRIDNGTATDTDRADVKKVRIMINLDNTDYDAYRYAQIVMPYVVDIDDESGAYCFDNYDIAIEVANGEERIIKYLQSPGATDAGYEKELQTLDGWFKKIFVEPVKAVVKAVEHSFTTPVKTVVNLAKGNVKEAFVNPLKTAIEDTKNVAKTSYESIKESVVIGGKLFKVLLIKINPLTVLIRNSWRGLTSLNFLGMATRLGVGLLTEKQADELGYTKETWQKAVKAMEKAKKLYKHMGGNPDKFVKSVKNGFNKKPLFKGDIRPDSRVNFDAETDDGEATLGDYGISEMIILALSVISAVWKWISSIVAARQARKEAASEAEKAKEEAEAARLAALQRKEAEEKRLAEQEAALKEEQKIYAFNDAGWILDQNGQRVTWEDYWRVQESTAGTTSTTKTGWVIAAAAAGVLLVGAVALSGNNNKRKR